MIPRNQSIDSSGYEWESLSNASCELGVDVIHVYATQANIVEESSLGSDEFGSKTTIVDHTDPSRSIFDLDAFGNFTIGSTSHVTRDDSFRINNLEASTSLSLIHPDLIDWSAQRSKLPSF